MVPNMARTLRLIQTAGKAGGRAFLMPERRVPTHWDKRTNIVWVNRKTAYTLRNAELIFIDGTEEQEIYLNHAAVDAALEARRLGGLERS